MLKRSSGAGRAPDEVNSMSAPAPRRRRIEVEEVGDIAVVSFVDRRLLDEQNIQMVGDDLFRLVDELGRRKVLLNFGNVEFMNGAVLGKLITLHRKLQAVRGKLVICAVPKDLRDLFRITKLDRYLTLAPGPCAAVDHPALFDDVRPLAVACSPDWRTDTVLALARHMSESRDFDAMPILADALQDAGCDSAEVLDHCRGDEPHVRGCWVVDLVLGKA